MSVNRLAPLVVPAAKQHTATVIFVHGLGDTGHGWALAVGNWRRGQQLDEVKFILPHAPRIPFTFVALDGNVNTLLRQEDAEGIKLSQRYFHELIQEEIDSGIPADRIVLGGFSQGGALRPEEVLAGPQAPAEADGSRRPSQARQHKEQPLQLALTGAMSLLSGLTFKAKLAGIIGLSAWLVLSQSFPNMISPADASRHTPVIMLHGDQDPIVPTNRAKSDAERLTELGYNVTWKTYPGMGHSTSLEELGDVEAFLRARLPPNAGKEDEETLTSLDRPYGSLA
ncbi:Phospholipase/Carboxylesterase-domain-containing protein [Dactylonectria macrodidyma]|uniref:Acyl-protein thioesterase 1 n=1 Tax=Dactylonectria macrodidyma TaxID=307937 RepID=A0A9P9D4N7_9HYPO|nr:Phospholipase/Carboxylesterase-domain-containing protein [Dactylonectria macrodidyma]